MKKIIIAIIAVVILSITIFSVLSFDTVEAIDVKENDYGGYTVTNQMKSGETVDLSVLYSVKTLADGVYHVRIDLGDRNFTDSDGKNLQNNYEIKNIRVDLCIAGNPAVEYAACSGRRSDEPLPAFSPRLSYNDDKITASYEAADSVSLDMFLIGDFDLSELDLTYDIKGKGARLLNRVSDNAVTIRVEEEANMPAF